MSSVLLSPSSGLPFVKRIFDLLLSLFVGLVFALPILIVAILVKL